MCESINAARAIALQLIQTHGFRNKYLTFRWMPEPPKANNWHYWVGDLPEELEDTPGGWHSSIGAAALDKDYQMMKTSMERLSPSKLGEIAGCDDADKNNRLRHDLLLVPRESPKLSAYNNGKTGILVLAIVAVFGEISDLLQREASDRNKKLGQKYRNWANRHPDQEQPRL